MRPPRWFRFPAFGGEVLTELRAALLSLKHAPGFSLVAVVTLGLGIGANTSMFGILNGILLRPAPYPDSGRLDRIFRATPQNQRAGVAAADYLDLQPEIHRYGTVAAYAYADVSLSEPGRPAEMALALRISANLLSTLGAQPRIGRGFHAGEELPGNHRVLILGHRYWQTRFGSDERVLGRGVRVGGELHEVVGVLPAGFSDWRHLASIDVFQPLALTELEARDRSTPLLNLVGRRSSAVSRAEARAFFSSLDRRLGSRASSGTGEASWNVVPIGESVLPPHRKHLLAMLVGLSGFVLLIACSNLANLVLARTVARGRELALRSALGASRFQALRPLVLESLLLALVGGVCAVLVAVRAFDWLSSRAGIALALDWRVLGWTLAVSLLAMVGFTAAPTFYFQRIPASSVLHAGSRGMTGDRGPRGFGQLLVGGQCALAVVLLAGAALFLRGLDELRARRAGWQADRLVSGRIALPAGRYPGNAEITEFHSRAVQRLEALPGVASASISEAVPFLALGEPRRYLVAGREVAARVNGVSTHYFETVGTPLLSGRRFDEGDTSASPRVFVVNHALGRVLFGGGSPLGRQVAPLDGDPTDSGEIVGVVADVQPASPDPGALAFQLYRPLAQQPRRQAEIAVRARTGAPSALLDDVRASVASLDSDLPLRGLQPAELTIARATRQWDVLSSMLSTLAALGLGLASLGLYGIASRAVAQRRSEFGVRLALGARPGDIVRLVLASAARLGIFGCAVGVLGAIGVSRAFRAVLPGVHTSTLPVLAGVALLVIAVALVASLVPARRASRTSITDALRGE